MFEAVILNYYWVILVTGSLVILMLIWFCPYEFLLRNAMMDVCLRLVMSIFLLAIIFSPCYFEFPDGYSGEVKILKFEKDGEIKYYPNGGFHLPFQGNKNFFKVASGEQTVIVPVEKNFLKPESEKFPVFSSVVYVVYQIVDFDKYFKGHEEKCNEGGSFFFTEEEIKKSVFHFTSSENNPRLKEEFFVKLKC